MKIVVKAFGLADDSDRGEPHPNPWKGEGTRSGFAADGRDAHPTVRFDRTVSAQQFGYVLGR